MNATTLEAAVVQTQYRMQRVFESPAPEGQDEVGDAFSYDGAPVLISTQHNTDEAALGAFNRLLGHLFADAEGEHWVLIAPDGRTIGAF